MYKYETHLHSSPVSACAGASVREHMEFYKSKGYDGIFITNHFIDGNICHDIRNGHSYEEMIEYYFSDYEEAKKLEREIGIKVFCGVDSSYSGTDFLIYGLDKEWYLSHPEIREMRYSDFLRFLCDNGALVIQAHPFREAGYIDHIRLFPRSNLTSIFIKAALSARSYKRSLIKRDATKSALDRILKSQSAPQKQLCTHSRCGISKS